MPAEEAGSPPKQRRLPTKTRSGIISLPGKTAGQPDAQAGDLLLGVGNEPVVGPKSPSRLGLKPAALEEPDDDDETVPAVHQRRHQGFGGLQQSTVQCSTQQQDQVSLCSTAGCPGGCMTQLPACSGVELDSIGGSPTAHPCSNTTNPGTMDQGTASPASPASHTASLSQPACVRAPVSRPPGRPGGGITGPLNSSTSPVVVSLPVKRRGSYQSLKRSSINGTLNSEDKTSVLALVRKPTHWEKFGTILVLYCAANKQGKEDGGVLQMMMAEGYDTDVVDNQADALASFTSKEVFPDMVIIDADHTYNTIQMIKQLQVHNPTVAVIVLGSAITRPGPTSALQAGAADYMRKPPDVEELMARIERHVQRQHCIKLELEKALDSVKNMMAQLAPTSLLGDTALLQPGPPGRQRNSLIAVAETDFEEQMAALSEENAVLGAKLRDMEISLQAKDAANRELESQLKRIDDNADGYGRRLVQVENQSATLMHKVDELQQLISLERRTPS